MEKFAIIKIGGKQYKVREGEVFKVDKMENKEGEKVVFDKVLLKVDGENLEVGKPYLDSKVEAEVKSVGKEKSKIVFRYRPKKRYRKKNNYRTPYTEIKVLKI
jgi:large subunit ribosomal protein L21